MTAAHVVEQLQFEVAFASEAEAFDLQSRIGRFAGERTPRIVEQVFSEAAGGAEVLQYERLEVDLGRLPLHESDQEWEDRLAQALRRQLEADRQQAEASPAVQQRRRVAREQADFELLWHWLHHGSLPWHATQGDTGAVDALVARVLARQGPALAAALRASRHRDRLLRRAVRQWSQPRLLALGRLLGRDEHAAGPATAGRELSVGEGLLAWESWLQAQLLGQRPAARKPAADLAAAPGVDEALPRELMRELTREVGGPRAAQRLARQLADALRADPLTVARLLRRAMPTAGTWAALLPWWAPAERRRLVATLAPAGDVEFLNDLADSVVLRSLAGAAGAGERAVQLQAAVLRLLQGLSAPALDRREALRRVLAELAGTPGAGGRPAAADSPARLRPLLQSRTLVSLTPATLLLTLREFAGEGSDPVAAPSLAGVGEGPVAPGRAAHGPAMTDAALVTPGPVAGGPTGVASAAAVATSPEEPTPAVLAAATASASTGNTVPAAPAGEGATQAWLMAADAALAQARLPDDELAWRRLLHAHAAWLQRRLAHHGRVAAWRHAFVAALPTRAWHDVLSVHLSSGDQARLLEFCSAITARLRLNAPAPGDTSTEALVREAVLRWLVQPAGAGEGAGADDAAVPARFDAAACEAWLLRHLAEQHDLPAEACATGAPEPGADAAPPPPAAPAAAEWPSIDDPDLPAHVEALLSSGRRPHAPLRRRTLQYLASEPRGQTAWHAMSTARQFALARLLRPDDAQPLHATLRWLEGQALAASLPLERGRLQAIGRERLRQELFVEAHRFEPTGVTRRWLQAVRAELARTGPGEDPGAWIERLLQASGPAMAAPAVVESPAGASGVGDRRRPNAPVAEVRAALQQALKHPAWQPTPARAADDHGWTVPDDAPPDPAARGDTLYLHNAGLVLAGPYLPRLLGRLDLLDGQRFRDDEAAERAVHLLQWLASGRRRAAEHELVLNKLLCGLPASHPVPAEVVLSDEETAAVDGLLQALIAHWKVLGRTSVAGLRETFLMRDGALSHVDEGWKLVVAPRAFDMLLDQLPWGYKTLRFPWMPEVLRVEWR